MRGVSPPLDKVIIIFMAFCEKAVKKILKINKHVLPGTLLFIIKNLL